MSRYWIGTQIFLGQAERAELTKTSVRDAVRRARELAGLDGLIIAAGSHPAQTADIAAEARACGVESYLWFPVLADVPGVPARAEDLVVCADGARGNGRSGAWEGLAGGDEEFAFSCPNNAASVDRAFEAYTRLIDRTGVTGVMLDRIRFPSPANGFEALFTCFCGFCAARYQAETGRPLGRERERATGFLSRLATLTASSLGAEWSEIDDLWTAAGLTDLARFRRRSVVDAVRRFAQAARSRGLKVGLDLFSPSMAGLVSQDYRALAGLADWIKPMIYRLAAGPAGLPLELASLTRALSALCLGLGDAGACRLVGAATGWDIPESSAELLAHGLPESVIASELGRIRSLGLSGTAVYAGIEAVSIPAFHIDVTREVLERSLSCLGEPATGLIASWNLLRIPEENLRLIGALNA